MTKLDLSPEKMAVLEKLKDSKYFRESFFWIVNKDGRKIPYLQNLPQQKYYAERSPRDLILKSRKLGFSTEIEGDFLHDCMFIENTNAVTMSQTMGDTQIHMHRIQYFLKTMGTQEYPVEVTLDTENSLELYFPEKNSYYWTGTAGSPRFGRGRDITRFHGSEVAHWQDQSVLTGALEAMTRNARAVLETTACGIGEKFYELWEEAGDPKSGSPWKRHFFGWWMDPANVEAAA